MTAPGWYEDPSGRFSRRWFDGNAWADWVVSADGRSVADAMPEVEAGAPPLPPPSVAAPPVPTTAPAPTVSGPVVAPTVVPTSVVPTAATRAGPSPAAMAVGAAGVVLVLLSLFALDWAKGATFGDLHDAAGQGSIPGVDEIVRYYAQWGAYVLLVGVTVVAGLRLLAGRRIALVAAVVAGGAAVVHTIVVERLFPGPAPELGPWVASVGYLVVVGALGLSATRAAPQ